MSTAIVVAVYGCSVSLALLLLYVFGARRWYWHVASIALALAVGLITVPEAWRSPTTDLIIGGIFLCLFLWGICAPVFHRHHREHHQRPHHA